MKRKRLLLVALIVGLLITLFPLAAIAAPNPATLSDPPPPECNPRAFFLANLMGDDVTCEYLMEKQAEGIGFGLIMKAYFLSEIFDPDNWTVLLDLHQQDFGWGQIMKAYTLADLLGDVTAQDLLNEHAGGKGWGDILKERGLGPGKPPWAGQGKPDWAGPRPWAKGGRCPPKSRSPRCTE